MAQQYTNEIYPGVELPSAFAEPGEKVDDIGLLQGDFHRFLDHWRECALQRLEELHTGDS
jgi:hypothetical protein